MRISRILSCGTGCRSAIITWINRTEVGIVPGEQIIITPHLKKCALTANRRHASPRTQPQLAGRRSFLGHKNRRSRSCATGAYSVYVRMAHERDRRFLWLKSDGSSPTLTESRAHNPTIHAFRDRVHNRISRKLPTRTPLTYKIPNASPKGMHPHEQYKNVPNKTDETKAEIQQTSNYTKHNCKRQGTESNLTTTNQNAVRRIPNSKIPSEASRVNMNE